MQQLDPDNEKIRKLEEYELKVDFNNFEGDVEEIGEGMFVSFRYSLLGRKLVSPKV